MGCNCNPRSASCAESTFGDVDPLTKGRAIYGEDVHAFEVGDRIYIVHGDVFERMEAGKEYRYHPESPNIVVRKHEGQLFGRKLETFDPLPSY